MRCDRIFGLLLILASISTTPNARTQPANSIRRPPPAAPQSSSNRQRQHQYQAKPRPRGPSTVKHWRAWNKKRPSAKIPQKRGSPGPNDWFMDMYMNQTIYDYYSLANRVRTLPVRTDVPVKCVALNATDPEPRPAHFYNRTEMTITGQVIEYKNINRYFGTSFNTFLVSSTALLEATYECLREYGDDVLALAWFTDYYRRFEYVCRNTFLVTQKYRFAL